ncbi:MAG: CsbD family protein [Hyphomicrobiales bacterium]|nr:CsbD family protein [Hyphomicrobiales bacterium]
MGSINDKITGAANQAAGNVKQSLGKAIGDKQMETDGIVQDIKGDAQQAIGKAKDALKKVVDNT